MNVGNRINLLNLPVCRFGLWHLAVFLPVLKLGELITPSPNRITGNVFNVVLFQTFKTIRFCQPRPLYISSQQFHSKASGLLLFLIQTLYRRPRHALLVSLQHLLCVQRKKGHFSDIYFGPFSLKNFFTTALSLTDKMWALSFISYYHFP